VSSFPLRAELVPELRYLDAAILLEPVLRHESYRSPRGLARTTEGTERDAGSGDSDYWVPFATCRFIRGRLFGCFSFGCFVHVFGLCLFRVSFRSFGSSAVHALLTFALRDVEEVVRF
jgi:hypothetical protein